MTKSQYLDLCEQTGQEIDWEKCPLDVEDFPDSVLQAMNIYNCLGNRIGAEVGFIGKDFTNFNFLLNFYGVKDHEIDWLYEIILWLENRSLQISQDSLKEQRDKLQRQMKK